VRSFYHEQFQRNQKRRIVSKSVILLCLESGCRASGSPVLSVGVAGRHRWQSFGSPTAMAWGQQANAVGEGDLRRLQFSADLYSEVPEVGDALLI
jgi:hypothetical protein